MSRGVRGGGRIADYILPPTPLFLPPWPQIDLTLQMELGGPGRKKWEVGPEHRFSKKYGWGGGGMLRTNLEACYVLI